MARRMQTYAIRLAIEGGGQVKAELISVGQSGEQSLKRIESAGERASGGLKGLGRQAGGCATASVRWAPRSPASPRSAAEAALVDRSISAANAIGKTADTIGVGVEALQELRFAAKASGVEQQTLAVPRRPRRARARRRWHVSSGRSPWWSTSPPPTRAPFVRARARSQPIWRARSIGRAGTDERRSVPRRHGDAQGVALGLPQLVQRSLRSRSSSLVYGGRPCCSSLASMWVRFRQAAQVAKTTCQARRSSSRMA